MKKKIRRNKTSFYIKATIAILLVLCLIFVVNLNRNHSPEYKPDLAKFKTSDTSDSNSSSSSDSNTDEDTDEDTSDDDSETMEIIKTGKLNYTVNLNGIEEVIFKLESGVRSYFSLKVNDEKYSDFAAKIYSAGSSEEFTFNASDLKTIDLRIGYHLNHHFYINGVELPDEQSDYNSDSDDLIITFEE